MTYQSDHLAERSPARAWLGGARWPITFLIVAALSIGVGLVAARMVEDPLDKTLRVQRAEFTALQARALERFVDARGQGFSLQWDPARRYVRTTGRQYNLDLHMHATQGISLSEGALRLSNGAKQIVVEHLRERISELNEALDRPAPQ